MITLKAFLTMGAYYDNHLDKTSKLFELSTQSRTYARDVQEINYAALDADLVVFRSTTGVGTLFELTTAPATGVQKDIELATASIIKKITNTRATKQDFISQISAAVPKADKVDVGHLVTTTSGTLTCPDWFKIVKDTEYDVKVWLSDTAFQYQYSDYVTYASLPFEDINVLLGGYDAAKAAIDEFIIDDLAKDIDRQRKSKPETLCTLTNFSLHHPDAPAGTAPLHLPWAVLSYGEAGANIDAVKLALRDAILNNSNGAHTVAEWTAALPDIFRMTEFAIVPRWDIKAIHGYSGTSDIYSPNVPLSEVLKEVKDKIPYDLTHVNNSLTLVPFQYASLMLYICPGFDNDVRASKLSDLYPDYFFTGITSEDTNRMSMYTVEWVRALSAALQAAEVLGPDSEVPHGMHKIYRAGKVFVSFTYDRINYLVYGKLND